MGANKQKVKMPYTMLQGMQKKNKEKMHSQKDMDRKLGIIGESHRDKKYMQSYFESKDRDKQEAKKLNLDTDRGINWHKFSGAKYKAGALTFSNNSLKKVMGGD